MTLTWQCQPTSATPKPIVTAKSGLRMSATPVLRRATSTTSSVSAVSIAIAPINAQFGETRAQPAIYSKPSPRQGIVNTPRRGIIARSARSALASIQHSRFPESTTHGLRLGQSDEHHPTLLHLVHAHSVVPYE